MAHKDFFDKKKHWSIFKDRILKRYLAPFIAKLLYTNDKLTIIDCFAGKGYFTGFCNTIDEKRYSNDELEGSPIIIAKAIKKVIEHQNSNVYKNRNNLFAKFIECNHHKELSENIKDFKNCEVIEGTFKNSVNEIITIHKSSNIFLYLDPYGIKDFDFEIFKRIKDSSSKKAEFLMNFNSFIFLRLGAKILNMDIDETFETEEESIVDDCNPNEKLNSRENLNKIANGSYWEDILKKYYTNKKEFTWIHAEEEFTQKYTEEFKKIFKYSINFPMRIKVKEQSILKYRLIFGTNHEDGLTIMVDNMNKIWGELSKDNKKGKKPLFGLNEEPILLFSKEEQDIEKEICNLLEEKELERKNLYVKLIEKYGICYSTQKYDEYISNLEKKIKITVNKKTYYGKEYEYLRLL